MNHGFISLCSQKCVTDVGRCGLAFFGTPHAGPGDGLKVNLGKACARVAQSLPGMQSTRIMDTLEHGSLFSDLLGEAFRHQLEHYQILSCYEGIGDVRNPPSLVKSPRHSADEKFGRLSHSHLL